MTSPRIALGVGLTNACDLACAHCYRAPGIDELDPATVLDAVTSLSARSVSFGTGENGLHPRFGELVNALADRGVAVTMTTNGRSAAVLDDATLARFRDVELSIDHPTEEAHDAARGPGNWRLIEEQTRRCQRLGVSTTTTTVLMRENARALPALARLAGERSSLLRINVYQPARGDLLRSLGYQEFWAAWRALFEVADLVVCGEPILRAALSLPRAEGEGCGGRTVRLTPRGAIVPCVYQGDDALSVDDLRALGPGVLSAPSFRRLAVVPDPCRSCPHLDTCGGGCASRRALRGDLSLPEAYCPILRDDDPGLVARLAPPERELPKASSACTTIVRYRGG